jgi:hypothetical protein
MPSYPSHVTSSKETADIFFENKNNNAPTIKKTPSIANLTSENLRPKQNRIRNMSSTMPSQSFAAPHTQPSPILSTSPSTTDSRDGGHHHHHHHHQRPHVELSSCQESYKLFKRCSTASKMECYSCSDAVASYMRCAMNDCQ